MTKPSRQLQATVLAKSEGHLEYVAEEGKITIVSGEDSMSASEMSPIVCSPNFSFVCFFRKKTNETLGTAVSA